MTDDAVSILQLTDLHLVAEPGRPLLGIDTAASFEAALGQALRHAPPDLVLLTGDLAHEPQRDVYLRLIETVERHLGRHWLWTPGNHDLSTPMREALAHLGIDATQKRAARRGRWLVLMLDTHTDNHVAGRLAETELAWLRQSLDETDADWVLLAGHHPLQPVGTAWLDTDRVENAPALFELFETHPKVRLYVCGHVHQRAEDETHRVPLLTTPSTCFQFRAGSSSFTLDTEAAPGWRWIRLRCDGGLEHTVERLTS